MKMKRSRKVHERQLTQLQHSVADTLYEQHQQYLQQAACNKMTVLNAESGLRKDKISFTNISENITHNRNYQPKKTLCMTISTASAVILDHRQRHVKRKNMSISRGNRWLNFIIIVLQIIQQCTFALGVDVAVATTPMQSNWTYTTIAPQLNTIKSNDASWQNDSIFMRLAKRFSTGNELWDGIISDCYGRPTFSCFQKNVYNYLNEAFNAEDVNVTQRLKFFKNEVDYDQFAEPTESAMSKDTIDKSNDIHVNPNESNDEHNEIPAEGRAMPAETPIEEVTNALYDKTLKFALTHNVELQMPEVMFDGATFRVSPRSFEGNGIIAKLEIIPKQEVEARLAGKIIMKKIQKFLKSKLLLSFIALLLIIKIIKVKLFWLLPIIIGVGAAKKLLLKFLLFLFPALTHLFKLCSYYQQTYHSTKFHHHHHLINHHHTIVPAWHHAEHSPVPEIIYTDPPKGHISSYLHGAPIHETYGPPPSHEHFEGGWESSGPGLGSEYLSDINRIAQIDENTNYFKPHANDANELNDWGLGSTQMNANKQQQQQPQQLSKERTPQLQQHYLSATQQQRPPLQQQQQTLQKQQLQQLMKSQQQQQYQQQRLKQHIQQHQKLQPQLYQKPYATSHSFNPFISPDKQSGYNSKYKFQSAQSAPSPVYVHPARNGDVSQSITSLDSGLSAAQIAAQYEPTRSEFPHQLNQQLSPELAAQLKEAIRRQAEQRIIAQQQKILENQPFVQDGQPLVTKNYDPFYSPILIKIDKITEQLGIKDDLCKERVICSMYKDPTRYSPHSNFVSAELSRDPTELQPVSDPDHPAVIRFYQYIQAAREGQEQKNCLKLYPQCNINTE